MARALAIKASDHDFAKRVQPTLERLVAQMVTLRPSNPRRFMDDWLAHGGELDTSGMTQGMGGGKFVEMLETAVEEVIRAYVPPRYPLDAVSRESCPPPTLAEACAEITEALQRYRSAAMIQAVARGRASRVKHDAARLRQSSATKDIATLRSHSVEGEARAVAAEVAAAQREIEAAVMTEALVDRTVEESFYASGDAAERAAIDIQRAMRGKMARKQVELRKMEARRQAAELAAREARLAAAIEGENGEEGDGSLDVHTERVEIAVQKEELARQTLELQQEDVAVAEVMVAEADEDVELAETPEEIEAAKRIQAIARGRLARRKVDRLKAEADVLEARAQAKLIEAEKDGEGGGGGGEEEGEKMQEKARAKRLEAEEAEKTVEE